VTETVHMHSEVRNRTTTSSGTRTPDVFSETAHRIARWTLPVVLGLVYGAWVATNRRHGGPITSSDLALGVGSTLAFAAIGIAVIQVTRHLRRDLHALHALVRAAFAGVALGFLYGQTGDGIRSVVLTSLATTAAVFLMLFYRYYTGDDA
jgi:peptidoglycan/LPS O-acetylase OafA/YrhL